MGRDDVEERIEHRLRTVENLLRTRAQGMAALQVEQQQQTQSVITKIVEHVSSRPSSHDEWRWRGRERRASVTTFPGLVSNQHQGALARHQTARLFSRIVAEIADR